MINSLWVRITLVLGAIVLFIAFLPFLTRPIRDNNRRAPPAPPATEGVSNEQRTRIEESTEERLLGEISRTLLIGSLLGIGASVILTRWLVAPLNQLEQGTRAVAERRLDYRLPEVGSREVQSVARSFNRMTSQLEQQEELRRNLLADVTHELRHPVHVIQGSLQAVLDGVYPLNMEEILLMLEQTQHLTALVEDLHALARAEARELPLYRQPTDIASLTQDVADSMMPLAEERHLALTVERPKEGVMIEVDSQRLRQVIQNLVSNAIRYTPDEGTITLRVMPTARHTTISIEDTGMGIPSEDLPRVFDRFYRGDASRNRASGGAGLGLAITKAIVEAHGGTVTAMSEGVNQGSKFIIQLPVVLDLPPAPVVVPPRTTSSSSSGSSA